MAALRTWTSNDQSDLRVWVQARLASTPAATAQTLWNLMHAPTSVSRGSAPTVPTPFTVAQIVAALSVAATVSLSKHQIVDRFIDCINSQATPGNLANFGNYCGGFVKDGTFSTADYTACMTFANATYADPSWQATALTGPSPKQSLFPTVDQWWTTTDPATAAGSSMITLANLQGAMV